MEVSAPCHSTSVEIRLGGSFGAFISLAPLGKELVDRPRLLDGILAHWFGHDSRRTLASIDGSLAWLVENYANESHGKSEGDWRLGSPYTPRWSPGSPVLPDLEAVTLLTQPEQELGAKLAKQLAVDETPKPPVPLLLVYFAHNHHRIEMSAKTSELAVHITDHAVAVEDRHRHRWSWAFVASGQTRLRKPSIARTATDGALVAIELAQDGGENEHRLIIVDPRSGRWASRTITRTWSFDATGLRLGDEVHSRDQLAALLIGS